MMAKKRKLLENETKASKKVDFILSAPEAQNVFLAGDFNDWEITPHPLEKDSTGNWKINIDLMPGRYEYRFLVDGVWQNDPNSTAFAPNPFGSENCVLKLK
jgi:1,4-alpha-glucan branching enzyme